MKSSSTLESIQEKNICSFNILSEKINRFIENDLPISLQANIGDIRGHPFSTYAVRGRGGEGRGAERAGGRAGVCTTWMPPKATLARMS